MIRTYTDKDGVYIHTNDLARLFLELADEARPPQRALLIAIVAALENARAQTLQEIVTRQVRA